MMPHPPILRPPPPRRGLGVTSQSIRRERAHPTRTQLWPRFAPGAVRAVNPGRPYVARSPPLGVGCRARCPHTQARRRLLLPAVHWPPLLITDTLTWAWGSGRRDSHCNARPKTPRRSLVVPLARLNEGSRRGGRDGGFRSHDQARGLVAVVGRAGAWRARKIDAAVVLVCAPAPRRCGPRPGWPPHPAAVNRPVAGRLGVCQVPPVPAGFASHLRTSRHRRQRRGGGAPPRAGQ